MDLEDKRRRRAELEAEVAAYHVSEWEQKVTEASAAKEAASVRAMVEGTSEARAAADRAATALRNAIEAAEEAAEKNRLQLAALEVLRAELRGESRAAADSRAAELKAELLARLEGQREILRGFVCDALTVASLGRFPFVEPQEAGRVFAQVAGIDLGTVLQEARQRANQVRRGEAPEAPKEAA